jgi:hypothetical protein
MDLKVKCEIRDLKYEHKHRLTVQFFFPDPYEGWRAGFHKLGPCPLLHLHFGMQKLQNL